MRIRTVKPEFWSDEKTGTLRTEAALLFLAMFNFADDKGRLRGAASLLKAQAFPYKPEIDVERALKELLALKLVQAYKAAGQSYLEITNFSKHQKINRPSNHNLMPEPEVYETIQENKESLSPHGVLSESSVSPHDSLSEPSVSPHCRKGREGKGKEGSGKERKGKEKKTTSSPKKPATVQKGFEDKKTEDTQAASTFQSLKTALEASYKQKRGEPYLFAHGKDGSALKRLIGLYTPNVILERWEVGLDAVGYRQVNNVAQLAQKWNDLAAPSTPAKATSVYAGRNLSNEFWQTVEDIP
jgi:hypothetical protein